MCQSHTATAEPQVHYERRRPEETILYQLIQENLETFFAQVETETGTGLPDFVKDEFEAVLECGRSKCCVCPLDKRSRLTPSLGFFSHELGPATQTGSRYRHRTLPSLWRHTENHCRHRRARGDCQDSRSSRLVHPGATSVTATVFRSPQNGLISHRHPDSIRFSSRADNPSWSTSI